MHRKKPSKRKHAKRLAKGVRANQKRPRVRRTRKDSVRPKSGSQPGGTVADEREGVEIARLVGALRAEKIRFQLVGMSAAVLQGVPVMTVDIDLWIDLPSRQYMRVLNIARR